MAQEKSAIQAQIERVKQSGSKWVPVLSDTKVLDDLSNLVESEETRLSKIDIETLAAGAAAVNEAQRQLAAGDLTAAKASLEKSQKLWSQHVLLASLQESLKKAQDEAKKSAASTPRPTPAPTPPQSSTQSSWKLNEDVRIAASAETPYLLEWRTAVEGWREVQLEFIVDGVRSEYVPASPSGGWIGRIGDRLTKFFREVVVVGSSQELLIGEWVTGEIDPEAARNVARQWILTGRRENSEHREPVSHSFRIVWKDKKLEPHPEKPSPARPNGAAVMAGMRTITRLLEAKSSCAPFGRQSVRVQAVFSHHRSA
jgi:hypothetical protein